MEFNLGKLTKHVMINLTTHINNVRLNGNNIRYNIILGIICFKYLTRTIIIIPIYTCTCVCVCVCVCSVNNIQWRQYVYFEYN